MKRINKRIFLVLPLLLLSLCFLSCKKDELSDFQKLVESIYNSEEIIAGYNETNIMKDNDLEVYNKTTDFRIQRGEKIKSDVTIVEKKLSSSGITMYDETTTSYTTIDNIKYTVVNGVTYENEYEMPTYYLTFVLSEEFLANGYQLSRNEDDLVLKANVLDNKISSLFLNKSVGNVSNLSIEIVINDSKLQTFKANYTSSNGFNVSIDTTYLYATEGQGKAVFYLEGGTCKNSKDRVSYIYQFNGSVIDMLIVDPNVLETDEKDMISKNGYHIEGWYQSKNVLADGTVDYTDKWDFSKDRMNINGVTLYAKWEENRIYTYELYYRNENNEEVFLDKYEVEEGEKFSDIFLDNKKVEGYTSLGYLDENGEEWDKNFTHPGGDNDLAVKLYLNLVEGEYTVVKTAREFTSALTRNEDIYLCNDIDMDGKKLCYEKYSGKILGNGHTISNFEIDYDSTRNGLKGELDDLNGTSNHLYISLFFELNDATLIDLSFEDFVIDVDTSFNMIKYIIIAPLAITSSNATLDNVKLSGNITFTKTPSCEIEVIFDDFFYNKGENVTVGESSSAILVGDLPADQQ